MEELAVYRKSFSRENFEHILERNKKFKTLSVQRRHVQELIFLDTFDWRLWNEGYCLVKEDRTYSLLSRKNYRQIIKADLADSVEFAEDIPEGEFKKIVFPIIFVRKLIPYAELTLQEGDVTFFNKDDKTVLRGVFQDINFKSPEHFNYLKIQLKPLRGYNKARIKGEGILKKKGFKKIGLGSLSPVCIPREVMSHFRRKPGKYKSKVSIDVSPDETIITGSLRILSKLVSVIKENRQGVIDDVDTEFLHDFRVSIRRSRSFISQVKHIFTKNVEKEIKSFLKQISGFTGPVRDLDVYLLNKSHFHSLVEPKHQAGMDNFFALLEDIRENRRKQMVAFLMSPEFYGGLKRYEDILQEPRIKNLGPAAQKRTGKIASKCIYKLYLNILVYFDDTDRSEHRIHEIRILCKKLRYLLEFFASIFPKKIIKKITRELKQLQEQLGIFNDRHVQRELIAGYLQNPYHPLLEAQETKDALNDLKMEIERAGTTMKDEIESALRVFCDAATQDCFKELFETAF